MHTNDCCTGNNNPVALLLHSVAFVARTFVNQRLREPCKLQSPRTALAVIRNLWGTRRCNSTTWLEWPSNSILPPSSPPRLISSESEECACAIRRWRMRKVSYRDLIRFNRLNLAGNLPFLILTYSEYPDILLAFPLIKMVNSSLVVCAICGRSRENEKFGRLRFFRISKELLEILYRWDHLL